MSHNPSDNSSNTASEWDRLWQVVRATPDDFNSWEQLVRIAESPEGGLTKTSPPENIARLEAVYNDFLTNFPLFFGYWKKYADWELAVNGPEQTEHVFEKGVAGIRNSIDLWNQYIDFKIAQNASLIDIESLLERAAANVGYDFLAHPFWDKYLEFAETRLEDPTRVLRLLDRIVLIPMHQYARYYEKWRGLRANSSPAKALDPTILEVFTNEIIKEKGQLSPAELDSALKEKMDAQTAAVYATTQEGTNKRWVYESEIKRSYFHVKPLDRPQLQNWSKYLDFEEAQNNVERIRALYERCLVPCAQYEEFWLRYGQWLSKNNLLEDAKNAYTRAATTFLPHNNTRVTIALALIQEEEGDIDGARQTYTSLLEKEPSHLETILNYIHFERRQNESVFENLVSTYLNTTQLEASAKAFITVQYAKFLKQKNQIDKARELYSISASLYPQNKFFWTNYIAFELSFDDEESDSRITTVFETAQQSLPKESQTIINTQYRDYLLERGTSIVKLNRNPLTVSTDFTSNPSKPAENNLKRPAEDTASYGYAKQARVDNPQQQQNYNYSQYGGGDYYNQQGQQQQQPWQS